ncbi:hypothetical protein CEXT_742091 [Caerostris extrusa]|uniref:Uncharacterized protein n=1 Tax=Caerostris extrusa TaxID=172846 RepID=A0AAV4SJZ9_CAEEX|nr:hypothetical protein CEXT_742091 [Caerostris extrusa]
MKEKQFSVGRRLDRRSFRNVSPRKDPAEEMKRVIFSWVNHFLFGQLCSAGIPTASLTRQKGGEKSTICDLRRLFENIDSKENNSNL